MSNGLREALARAYPSGEEDLAKNPEAWAFADTLLPVVAAALDAAEARGQAEVAAKVEWLADHITALDVSTVKAPGLVDRLRAIVAEATQ